MVLPMKLNAPAAKAIREVQGLRCMDVAKKCGVTQGQLSNWEAGRRNPTDSNIYALAGALGVTPAAITLPEQVAA